MGTLPSHALRPQMYVRRPLLIKPRFAASALNNWFLRGGGMTGMLSFHISAERLRCGAPLFQGWRGCSAGSMHAWVQEGGRSTLFCFQGWTRVPGLG